MQRENFNLLYIVLSCFIRITIFCISKVPELIDTLFIVLRKQKLIFLHWFHHATVLIYSWYRYVFISIFM
jgi:hypothetical protein